MMQRAIWFPLVLLLFTPILGHGQVAETFTKSWEGSMGGFFDAIASNPRDAESYYVAFQVRKFSTQNDVYTYLAKMDCEGDVEWRLGVEMEGHDETFVDMAVLSDGSIGILQESNNQRDMVLHWVSRGGTVRTSLQITVDEDSNPWQLIPHPTEASFMIIMGYDLTDTERLILLEVNESGNALTSVDAGPYEAAVESADWPTDDKLVLQTGTQVREIDLNTGQTAAVSISALAPFVSYLYTEGEDVYISFTTNEELHVMKLTNLELQWYRTHSATLPYRSTRIAGGAQGPVVSATRGGENIFLQVDREGNSILARRVPDNNFDASVTGFDLDENSNWLYLGSNGSNGLSDFTARLNPQSSCVEAINLSLNNATTTVETVTIPDFQAFTANITSATPATYSEFPPEDYLCRANIDSLESIFRDTTVRCDTALVLQHGLSSSYLINGQPLSDPLVIRESGVYTVSIERCNMTERVNFDVEFEFCNCQWYFPNTFTPNGDNINDVFIPEGECLQTSYQMQIFDRWGNLVFESQNPFVGWEGKFNNSKSNPGTYVYVIRYTPIPLNEEQVITGTITLIR
jgi:gliding motility-associated-like protein